MVVRDPVSDDPTDKNGMSLDPRNDAAPLILKIAVGTLVGVAFGIGMFLLGRWSC